MNNQARPTSILLLDNLTADIVYGEPERSAIGSLTNLLPVRLNAQNWPDHPDLCQQVEVIFSSWDLPVMDANFLSAFPRLKAIFYAAGTVSAFVTDAFWERGIVLSSAHQINSIPVCEFTIAHIALSAKNVWRLSASIREHGAYPDFMERESTGMYEAVIGLISLGMIGRMVAERLRQFDVKVIAYDPFASTEQAQSLGVELCSLEELFQISDVISCHTPLNAKTQRMLGYAHFASMKPSATFINTARGGVIDEPAMIQALKVRADITAILDVTDPEPPQTGSELYTLPNVRLTPHIAGSKGNECRRMAHVMIDECRRYLSNEPLKHSLTPDKSC